MPPRSAGLGIAAGIFLAVGLSSCSPMDVDEHEPWPPENGGAAGALAERAGCRQGGEVIEPSLSGYVANGWECIADGRWAVNVEAGLTAEQVDRYVARLNDRRQSAIQCPDGSLSDPGVLSGPDWVAYVSDHEGAAILAERLGGELRPNAIPGPPFNMINIMCPNPTEVGASADAQPP